MPPRSHLTPIKVEELQEEPTIDHALIEGGLVVDDVLSHGMIDASILDGLMIIGGNADAVIFRNVEMQRCDWSNTTAESSSWSKVLVDGCKLTGTQLNLAVMKDVSFTDCRADLIQLQNAKLQRTSFRHCNLQHAYFNGAKLPKTIFEACDLTGADFSNADIRGSDLRRSKIDGIRIGPEQLRDVIVTQDQALYLASLLGLVVRDS